MTLTPPARPGRYRFLSLHSPGETSSLEQRHPSNLVLPVLSYGKTLSFQCCQKLFLLQTYPICHTIAVYSAGFSIFTFFDKAFLESFISSVHVGLPFFPVDLFSPFKF